MVARPTRTPIQRRPTRTPQPTATRRPTRTPLGGTAARTPAQNPQGLKANCSLRQTHDLVSITLVVENRTGGTMRNLVPGRLILEPEGGSLFFDRSGPSPQLQTSLGDGVAANFQWGGRLSQGGTMGFSVSVSGTGLNNESIQTGPVDCGVGTSEGSSFDPSGFSGTCHITRGDDSSGGVSFTVRNATGGTLTNITPILLGKTSTGTAQVLDLWGPGPRSINQMTNTQSADFAWRARVLGIGRITMRFEGTATRPNGQSASTGTVECSVTLSDSAGLPDLAVDELDLRDSLMIETRNFEPDDCNVSDGCVNAPGERRILRFTTTAANLGSADFFMGDAAENPAYQFSECRDRWIFWEYSDFRLLDMRGNLVTRGHKEAFCLVDGRMVKPDARRSPQFTHCGFQGVSAGWADIYHAGLDCQWVDITDVPAGQYMLSVHVNPSRIVEESDFSNNIGQVEVTIPEVPESDR